MYKDKKTDKLLEFIKNNKISDFKIKDIQEILQINHPQKLYDRFNKLIKLWCIDEDYNYVKWLNRNKKPFYWFTSLSRDNQEYPRCYIETNVECSFVSRIVGKNSALPTWTTIYINKNYEFENWNMYLLIHNWNTKVKILEKKKWNYILKSEYPDIITNDIKILGELVFSI